MGPTASAVKEAGGERLDRTRRARRQSAGCLWWSDSETFCGRTCAPAIDVLLSPHGCLLLFWAVQRQALLQRAVQVLLDGAQTDSLLLPEDASDYLAPRFAGLCGHHDPLAGLWLPVHADTPNTGVESRVRCAHIRRSPIDFDFLHVFDGIQVGVSCTGWMSMCLTRYGSFC
jgi:hypothetical protein